MDLNPISVLNAARSRVAAVNYALGLAGVSAASAIILFFVGRSSTSIVILGLTFVGMILLFVFSIPAAEARTGRRGRSKAIILASTSLIVATVAFFLFFLTITATVFAFEWPCPWARFIGVEVSRCEAGPRPTRAACNPSIFSIGGATGYDLNDIGLIDTFMPRVARGSQFVFGLTIRDSVPLQNLSCLMIFLCQVETANFCRTYSTDHRHVEARNSFSIPIRAEAPAGAYRLHLRLWKVSDPSQLRPSSTGVMQLSGAQLYSEQRDFQVQ